MQNTDLSIEALEHTALHIRKSIISSLFSAKSGHSAGPLDMVEILVTLYFSVLKHDPHNPQWEERDRVVLSHGHTCPGLYATLAHAGYFDMSELDTLRDFGSRLQGHPEARRSPGIENTSGPLGQGLSQALGMGLSFRLNQKPNRVFCLMSDGEHQEGQTWEAYMFGGKYKLNNVTVLIDRNKIQIDGFTEKIMPLEPLKLKLEAFNWNVLEVDGHDFDALHQACNQAKAMTEKPTAIICNTIPGHGVAFMENLPEWHGKIPSAEEAQAALQALTDQHGRRWPHAE